MVTTMKYRRVEEGYTDNFSYGNQHLLVPPVALVACFGKPTRFVSKKDTHTIFRSAPGMYLFEDEDGVTYAITVAPRTHLDVVKDAPKEKVKVHFHKWKKNSTEDGFWNSEEPYRFDVDSPRDKQAGLAKFVRWATEQVTSM
jgi:hypothetical protein